MIRILLLANFDANGVLRIYSLINNGKYIWWLRLACSLRKVFNLSNILTTRRGPFLSHRPTFLFKTSSCYSSSPLFLSIHPGSTWTILLSFLLKLQVTSCYSSSPLFLSIHQASTWNILLSFLLSALLSFQATSCLLYL